MATEKNKLFNVNRGTEACKHPSVITEYVSGSLTGNFICTQCKCQIPASLQRAKAFDRFWTNTRHDLIF